MISVVMITMNEEKAVKKVVEDIRTAVPGAEIIIVDSSSDRTPEIAQSLGVKLIRQFPPRGYGNAMMTALRSATGDAVVTLDCDGTYPACMIPILAGKILTEGYDIVDGSRLRHKPKAMPWINFIGNALFALLASLLFFRRLRDLHSGMRAYRRDLLHKLEIDPKGAALPVELLLHPLKMGYKIAVTYIDYFERKGKSTMRPFESAWWTLKRILRSRFK
ncbi:MAG: glycosyltransferase family 2 protein [Candidatus Magasanikbacteria bacterium]|nr:glycosyltransferase family 2 protein [Candidatus Magasanikbacteria bacterium]